MLRGARVRCAAWRVGGLRAVFGHLSRGGLRLPHTKAPFTLARLVIPFGPEPCQWGSGSFALRVGVGRRNGRLHCWVGTPTRKIRAWFRSYKHTSLVFLIGSFSIAELVGIDLQLVLLPEAIPILDVLPASLVRMP